MLTPYAIKDVSDWPSVADEPQGGKKKCWLLEPDTSHLWLFKDRSQGGDDWAEKVAGEIAGALGIPRATVELAQREDVPGVISLDFTENRLSGDLVLGNDLLLEMDPLYPSGNRFRVSAHTVDKVLQVLSKPFVGVPPGTPDFIAGAPDLVLGYLMLDALIGNTDRHHENWGILRRPQPDQILSAVLAPSFDHAASLGQILQDQERRRRLQSRDGGYAVPAYVRRARSALYASGTDPRPLTVLDAFSHAARLRPEAARAWQASLAAVSPQTLSDAVHRVPEPRASEWAKKFSIAMLHTNQQLILELEVGSP